MNTINDLHESLLNRGKIFRKDKIIELIEEYERLRQKKLNHKNIIEYLVKHDYMKRIFLGYYYINSYDEKKRKFCDYSDKELLFYVLNNEKIKWYMGLNTALYEQGKTWQTPVAITIINTRVSGKKKIFGSLKIKFIKTKENLIFGLVESKTKHKISYFYSNPAKTYLDKVYFKESEKLVSLKNTKTYLKRYPKWVGRK